MTNVLLLTLAISRAAVTQESVPQEHFQQGKQLIEANCGDCIGSTRAGLERGIAEVRKALEMGYPDKLDAYRLLGEAYNTLALVFAKIDSPEGKEAWEQRRRAYEKILDLDPSDVESRHLYVSSLQDKAQKMAQYRKILELKPDHTDAMFRVGMLLVEEGRSDEGLDELRKAFDLAPWYDGEPYGRALIRVLTDLGRKQEADEIAKKLKEKLKPQRKEP